MKALLVLSTALCLSAAAHADDLLLVVNKGDDTLAIVDAETLSIEALVGTGRNPHEVAVSPDHQTAYVSDYGGARGNTVSVVDLETAERTAVWDLGQNIGPHGIWASPDGAHVWVTTETSGTVTEIAVATGEVTRVWATDQRVSHQLVPTPDSSKLYIANIGSGSVTVIDRRDDSVVSIPTGAGAEGIDVSADGAEVWVTNRAANTVSIIETATDTIIADFNSGGEFPIRAKFTTNGREVYVSNATSGDVAVFDARTRELLTTIDVGAVPIGIVMDADGSRAFIANTQDDFVTVIDTATRTVTGRIETGDEPDGMAWVVR
jgi:YVTN family beta-propeller protein